MLADVVLPSRRFQVFTYHIPNQLRAKIFVGSPVVIPLGSSVVSGVIVRILEKTVLPSIRSSNPTISFRDIVSVEATSEHSSLDQRLLKLVEHIAEYYLAPLSACLRLIVPPRMFNITKRLVLTEAGRDALSDVSMPRESQAVMQKLARGSNGVLRSSLFRTLPQAASLVTKLKKKGWIEERSTLPVQFPAKAHGDVRVRHAPVLSSASRAVGDLFEQGADTFSTRQSQSAVLSETMKVLTEELKRASLSGTFQHHIVIGTDDERLGVFQHVASTLFQQGRRILFLVPEVYHVEAIVKQLRGILSESVESYHGQLSPRVRAERWEHIRQGRIHLVVGTRSALFVPLPALGLIWIDQEEDASYQDEHLPYYHAREVARMRGTIEQALVVYGSFCPSLETYSAFRDTIQKNVQVASPQNPGMNLIDMRDYPSGTLLAPPLVDRLTQVLNEGEQAILILNRKGFSSSLICRDCGQTPACETCGVALKLFHRPSRLVCSYCGKSYPTPETCSSCMGTVFRFSGVGTQRLEEELIELFPSYCYARFDRDGVKTAEQAVDLLRKFRQGDIHILIGTEFLLHQPDPPSAKLVAFPQADLGLHLPDFRSAERTFLLFSKAMGLIYTQTQADGPSGDVFLQTRMPDHHVFQAMVQHDPHVFYQQELDLREALAYPPAAHILLLVVTGAQSPRVQRVVDFLAQQLQESGVFGSLPHVAQGMLGVPMVLGPLSSRKPGRHKKNRTIFLIKSCNLLDTQERLRKIQHAYDQQFSKEPVVYEVHVDPLDIQ